MTSNKTFPMNNKLLFFLLILANAFIPKKTIAQKREPVNRDPKQDTVIIDFLLRHGQFYDDIPISDTSNPKRFEMAKGNFFCDKIVEVNGKNRNICFYGFGSNYSHTRNYLLIETNDSYKILGASSLDDDLPRLYNVFGRLGNAIKANQKLTCYEFLIRNYNLKYPPSVRLIRDLSYKKNKN